MFKELFRKNKAVHWVPSKWNPPFVFRLVTSCLFTSQTIWKVSVTPTNNKLRHANEQTYLTPHRRTSHYSFLTLPLISRWSQRTAVRPRSAEPWRCTMCSWKQTQIECQYLVFKSSTLQNHYSDLFTSVQYIPFIKKKRMLMEIFGSDESVNEWHRDLWDVKQSKVVNPTLKPMFFTKNWAQHWTNRTLTLQFKQVWVSFLG